MPIDSRKIAIATTGFCTFLHLYSPQPLLPELAREFGVGPAEMSAVMTASTAAIALTAPFTGALADVIGRKRVISAAMLAVVIPMTLIAFSSSVESMIVWRFLQGLLLPPIFAVAIAYVGDEWPTREVPAVAGIYITGASIGGFCGRFVPGVLTDLVGWRSAFLTLAVMSLAGALVVLALLPRERSFVRSQGLAASARQMLAHLRNPQLVATYAIGFGVLFNFLATFTYISFHLAAPPFNRSPAFLGSIFVVYLAGSAVTLWTGRAIATFGRRNFVLWVLGLWAAGLLLTLIPSIPAIIVALILASCCGVLTQAASTSFVATTAQGGTSAAVGLYVAFFYVGGTVGG